MQRFFPSEFGNDVDRNHGVDEAKTLFDSKAKFRRAIEAEGIPHTYVVANFLTQHFLPTQSQLWAIATPLDKVIILEDGNTKSKQNTICVKIGNSHTTLVSYIYIYIYK